MRGYAINPTQYYNSNLSGAITINTGTQNISTVNCLFGCVANGIATDIDTIFGIIAPTTPKTSQVLFQSCSCELMLSNATNSNVKVQIYDIIARRDISGGTSNYSPDGYKWNAQIVSNVYGNNNLPITAGQHTMDIGAGADHAVTQS